MDKGFTFIEILVTLVIAVVCAFSLFSDYFTCHSKAKAQGLECDWGFIQGCMVKVDGKWIDYDRLRIMD